MWSRSELKQKAKGQFKGNYWKAVFVSLILVIAVGGSSGGAGSSARDTIEQENIHEAVEQETIQQNDKWEYAAETGMHEKIATIGFVVVLAVVLIVVLIIIIPFQVFLLNPLEVGCKKFFIRNGHGQAQVKEVTYAFDHGYLNIVKTLFFRDLFIILWTLLLIVPGIIKAYEYMMIPYLLSENAQMTREEAFALSKKMMYGNKWNAFVLDLSFLGWYILNIFTLGILGIFYINPYKNQTEAGLYEALKAGNCETQ